MGVDKREKIIKGYEDAQNEITNKTRETADQNAQRLKEIEDTAIAGKENRAQELSDAGNTMIQATKDANQIIEGAYGDAAKQLGEDLTAAQTEDSTLRKADARSSQILAATEAAAAIANLIGVGGFNAVNQTITPKYSQDWMKRADAAHQQRKQRIENIRERQRAAEERLAVLKGGNVKDLAGLAYKQTVTNIGQKDAIDSAKTKAAVDALNAQAQAAAKEQAGKAATNEQATKWRLQGDQHDDQMNLYRDRIYNSGGGGSTAKGGFTLSLGNAADGTGAVNLAFANEKSLINTILANRGKVNLSDKDAKMLETMARVGTINPNELASIVMRYIDESPELRQSVIAAADGVQYLTSPKDTHATDTPAAPAQQPVNPWQPATNGFLWDGRTGQVPPVEYDKPEKPQKETRQPEQKKDEGLKKYH